MADFLGLQNRVAIVTGAAGDIGRATVKLLVSHKVKVLALDINPQVHSLIHNDQVVTHICDVSLEHEVIGAVKLAQSAFGTVDVLINNAGKTLNKRAIETSAEEWDNIMAINARGYFLLARESLKVMQPRRQGAIVNVASVVSMVGMKATSAYSASKGAIAQLTTVLALVSGLMLSHLAWSKRISFPASSKIAAPRYRAMVTLIHLDAWRSRKKLRRQLSGLHRPKPAS